MVQVYGVVHHAEIRGLFSSEPLPLFPSRGLRTALAQFPRGTKVGVEWFQGNDWQEVQAHLFDECWNHKLDDSTSPTYDYTQEGYWRTIIQDCQEAGHELVFLEDKNLWFRYNKQTIRTIKVSQQVLRDRKGESEEHEYKRLLRWYERREKAELLRRKIHEIERDNAFLDTIVAQAVDVAVVGVAHSDWWIANRGTIENDRRISFDDSYAKEELLREDMYLVFVPDAESQKGILRNRISLERRLGLLKGKTLTGETPQYVGTWCMAPPSKGYFEMFVDKQERNYIEGRIEDCIGTATFTGEISPQGIHFVKQYQQAIDGALQGDIVYEGERMGEGFSGHFSREGRFGATFYLVKAHHKKPLDLAMMEYIARRVNKEDIPF